MQPPPASYYTLSKTGVDGHEEPLDRMAKHGVLIDGFLEGNFKALFESSEAEEMKNGEYGGIAAE